MRHCTIGALACVVLAAASPASAAVISFKNPDVVQGACYDLLYPPGGGIVGGNLRVYEEAGVRLELQTPYFHHGSIFLVDCAHQVSPYLGPIVDPPPYGPISMFSIDLDRVIVTSLTGAAIPRIRLSVLDSPFVPPGECALLFISVGISICSNFTGDLYFADYGFENVTSFSLWFANNFEGYAQIHQIEVPEPGAVALMALGLVAGVRRVRRHERRQIAERPLMRFVNLLP